MVFISLSSLLIRQDAVGGPGVEHCAQIQILFSALYTQLTVY